MDKQLSESNSWGGLHEENAATVRQRIRDINISELEAGKTLAQVVREKGIHPSLPCRWNLEIGCVSGFISRELAGRVRWVVATDINPHALPGASAGGVEDGYFGNQYRYALTAKTSFAVLKLEEYAFETDMQVPSIPATNKHRI